MSAALARDHRLEEASAAAPPAAEPCAAPEATRPMVRAHDDREPGPALAALLALASPEERAQILELRRDWLARHKPVDRAERLAVEAVVAVLWRLEVLAAVEARVLAALQAGERDRRLPGPATLARLRRELCAERERAERDLAWLRQNRPQPSASPWLAPARLEWLAAKLRDGSILAPAREGAPAKRGNHEARIEVAGPGAGAADGEAPPRPPRERSAPRPPCAWRPALGPHSGGSRRADRDDGLARLFRLLFDDLPHATAAASSAAPVAA